MLTRFTFAILVIAATLTQHTFAAPPKNVIFFIGDGMGFEQVKAAGMYENGSAGTLIFESFPYKGQVTTYSASAPVTDSAAAATALATGVKVNNKVIALATPGDNSELQTLLELAQSQGKKVGIVTTTYIAHATPASFAAHEPTRDNKPNIINDYLIQTKPNVVFGGAAFVKPGQPSAVGYTEVTDRATMQALDTESANYVWGLFGGEIPYEHDGVGALPHLSEMTETALNILDNDPNGFFVMIEGGKIDLSGHDNNFQRNVFETIEFAKSVQKAVDWAADRKDTLIIVTADHETGGLTVVSGNGKGQFPTATWSTTNHTAVNIPVYATGLNSWLFQGTLDNADFPALITRDEKDLKILTDYWLDN